ncbi:MAG: hypothetical protein E7609_05565 [Ruminococcaceae bacterium]|nr:hypothetical protein [Oscillospiraceae bacterium]
MKEKHLYRMLLWAVSVFGVLCFIFANSLAPASESDEESREFFSVLLSFFPSITHHIVRKLAHVTEYALLGVHASLAPILFSRRVSIPFCLGFGVLVAVADEGIQSLVPGRGPSLSDVMIDSLGYFIALLLMFFFFCCLSQTRRRCTHV